jgi:hypothetical protein
MTFGTTHSVSVFAISSRNETPRFAPGRASEVARITEEFANTYAAYEDLPGQQAFGYKPDALDCTSGFDVFPRYPSMGAYCEGRVCCHHSGAGLIHDIQLHVRATEETVQPGDSVPADANFRAVRKRDEDALSACYGSSGLSAAEVSNSTFTP